MEQRDVFIRVVFPIFVIYKLLTLYHSHFCSLQQEEPCGYSNLAGHQLRTPVQ